LARRALAAGKAVFVEKPLATTEAQLRRIERACASGEPRLMVGFNRRFAPMLSDMKEAIGNADGDLVILCRVNAGVIPQGHWVRDEEAGGGRIIGEVCHFVDLVQYLAGAHVMQVYARRTPREPDNVCVTLAMASGAVATIIYTASGNKAFPRERVEAFTGRTACAIDDFRRATFAAGGRRWGRRSFVADRGHRRELETFVECVRNGLAFPVAFRDYVNTTRATFAIEQSLREGRPVRVEP
ncbi:MAG: Gfo/Idh/MocA family protein, partial [Armatimonadota bacterium]